MIRCTGLSETRLTGSESMGSSSNLSVGAKSQRPSPGPWKSDTTEWRWTVTLLFFTEIAILHRR